MPRIAEQIEWLSLVDISGPFIVPAVLEQVFPQGLEKVETPRRRRIRSAYEEWRDAVDDDDPQLRELHSAWVLMVLQDMLEYEDAVLMPRQSLNGQCKYRAPEQGAEAVPDYAVRGDDGKFRLLISVWPPETDLEKPVPGDSWPASPLDRMTLLCRASEVRLGLVTDGERWMLVNAPVGATSGYAAWLARLWWQEPVTLRAFQSLLGVRRAFGPKDETLDALLERSAEFHEEVTDTLGEQVRRAVEILVQSLGRADQDRNGELLKDVPPAELYEAGLTVMMRMVFTLCAEERGLLLLGDPVYDQHYALSTLRARLREDADRLGVEVLERRHDAWSRMLAVFRAIYGGVEHESLRMPALGGSLFDPDRFPLLEGRVKGTSWCDTPSMPLPIDNRTVLLLLDALQVLEQKGGAQLLSYRALDVEQIGHVYEGLLEYTVARLDKVTVGLIGSQKVRHRSISLDELEQLKSQGQEKAVDYLMGSTGRSGAAIGKALARGGDEQALLRLIHACGGDEKLARRLVPFVNLIRADSWGTMLVYKPGSFAVVHGSDRRETGTHYTPRSLTESIVEKTLEPVVYTGPAEGEPPERWKLKTPAELLDLKVCDPAMGSGAFLVQVCRYLAERLVEAWAHQEIDGKAITADGIVLDALGNADPMPKSLDERLIAARRLIAERCLYGVDINPLAVELAKLSIWLVTMAKGRPFGFLDHNLRSGDSLLGIHRIDQLTKLTFTPDAPERQERLFSQSIGECVEEAVAIRLKCRGIPIRDIRDVAGMASLDSEARKTLEAVEVVADAMIGTVLMESGQPRAVASALDSLAAEAAGHLSGSTKAGLKLARDAREGLSYGVAHGLAPRRPLHWPLAFPEAFSRGTSGFDAVIGNPPFLGGKRITTVHGETYMFAIKRVVSDDKGAADLAAYFLLRAFSVLRNNGCCGLILTNSINEGDTREVGLASVHRQGAHVFHARPNCPWPGSVGITISMVSLRKGTWKGPRLINGKAVAQITEYLSDDDPQAEPARLARNSGLASTGTGVNGKGFILDPPEREAMLSADPSNAAVIQPYLTSQDINQRPDSTPSRFIINFGNMPEEQARRYDEPFRRVYALVKPIRDTLTRQVHETCFWKHWDRRDDMYAALRTLRRAIVMGRVSSQHALAFMHTDWIPFDGVVVFLWDDFAHFGLLQSSVHETWSSRFRTSLRQDPRYSVSDCFMTFPLAASLELTNGVETPAATYYEHRCSIMLSRQDGMTTTYNRFHDPREVSEDIVRLRALHAEMDHAVVAAYGWRDLDLGHGFQDTAQGVRFSVSDTARRAILDRLLALNQQQHEAEVIAGLHDKKVARRPKHS